MTTDTTSTQQTAETSTTATTDPNKQTADTTTQTAATTTAATTESSQTAKTAETPSVWGEKWREDYAGTDDKLLKRLQRYASPKDAVSALVAAQNKIAEGSLRKAPGEKATAEEIAEYRKANGIPEAPEKYLEALPNGLVIGDDDKPIMDSFAAALHGVHADPKVVHAAVDWYYKFQDEQEGLRQQANVAAKTATEDTLREEWGPDYRPNTNLINNFIGSMPKELQDELFQSATPDGKQIMNNPAMLKWLAQQARELNYTGTVLPSGEQARKSVDGRLEEIRKMMRENRSEYDKNEAVQAEYRKLLEDQQRIASRAA